MVMWMMWMWMAEHDCYCGCCDYGCLDCAGCDSILNDDDETTNQN